MDERRLQPGGEEDRTDAVPAAVGGPVECARIQEVLLEYFDRELGASAATLVREHLRRCPACQAEAAALAKVVEGLRAADPAHSMPSVLSARGRRRVVWAWTHPVLAWCVLRHRWVSLMAVLLVFAGIFLALRHWRMIKDPPPPGIAVWVRPRAPRPAVPRGGDVLPSGTGALGRAGAHAPRGPKAETSMP